jgi:hypothetical protein
MPLGKGIRCCLGGVEETGWEQCKNVQVYISHIDSVILIVVGTEMVYDKVFFM